MNSPSTQHKIHPTFLVLYKLLWMSLLLKALESSTGTYSTLSLFWSGLEGDKPDCVDSWGWQERTSGIRDERRVSGNGANKVKLSTFLLSHLPRWRNQRNFLLFFSLLFFLYFFFFFFLRQTCKGLIIEESNVYISQEYTSAHTSSAWRREGCGMTSLQPFRCKGSLYTVGASTLWKGRQ